MIYRRRCNLESQAKLESNIVFKYGQLLVRLLINDKKIVSEIEIDAHITIQDLVIPPYIPQPTGGKIKANLLFPSLKDKLLSEELGNIFPYLESYLFEFGISSIDQDNTTIEIIAENNQEDKELDIPFLIRKGKRSNNRAPLIEIIKDWMHPETIASAYLLRDLHIPFSFFRRAFIALEDDDFPVAFQSLFLIIEGFYGNGKHENLDKIFINDMELVSIVKSKLDSDKEFVEAFEKFPIGNIHIDTKGVFKSLVIARHHMSHFSISESQRPYITASNRREYRDITYALLSIVADVIDIQRVKLAVEKGIPIRHGSHLNPRSTNHKDN